MDGADARRSNFRDATGLDASLETVAVDDGAAANPLVARDEAARDVECLRQIVRLERELLDACAHAIARTASSIDSDLIFRLLGKLRQVRGRPE